MMGTKPSASTVFWGFIFTRSWWLCWDLNGLPLQ